MEGVEGVEAVETGDAWRGQHGIARAGQRATCWAWPERRARKSEGSAAVFCDCGTKQRRSRAASSDEPAATDAGAGGDASAGGDVRSRYIKARVSGWTSNGRAYDGEPMPATCRLHGGYMPVTCL